MWEVIAEGYVKAEEGRRFEKRDAKIENSESERAGLLYSSFFIPPYVAHEGCPRKIQVIHRAIPQQASQSSHSPPRGDLGLGKGRDETELTEFF